VITVKPQEAEKGLTLEELEGQRAELLPDRIELRRRHHHRHHHDRHLGGFGFVGGFGVGGGFNIGGFSAGGWVFL
jgi:hypothetical protein